MLCGAVVIRFALQGGRRRAVAHPLQHYLGNARVGDDPPDLPAAESAPAGAGKFLLRRRFEGPLLALTAWA